MKQLNESILMMKDSKAIMGGKKMDVGRIANTSFQTSSQLSRVQNEIQPSELKLKNTSDNELITKEKLEHAVKKLNDLLKNSNKSLRFRLHDELQEYYVQIVDDVTQEVIKEVPPKKLLDMYAAMNELWGILFDKQI
jgi:flagellar protein FlaG